MKPLNTTEFDTANSVGSDIGGYLRSGVPGITLINGHGEYFYFHHAEGDTMTVYEPDELDRVQALWAATIYVIADLKDMLPRNKLDASLLGSFTWDRSENMDAWRKAVGVPGLAWTKDSKVSISVNEGVYTYNYTSAEGTTSSSTFRLGEEVVKEFKDQKGQNQVRKTTTREVNGKLVEVSKVIDGGTEREYTKTREFTRDGMTMSMEFEGVVGRHYFIRD